jgi:hypothetical protein
MSRFSVTVSRSIGMVLGPLYQGLRKVVASRCTSARADEITSYPIVLLDCEIERE